MLTHSFGSAAGPLTVTATNIALPERAGVVDLSSDVLPPIAAELLRTPELLRRPDDEICFGVPRVCWQVDDWPALLRRMDSIGMIAWVRDEEAPRFRGVHCGAGLFGVQKKGTDVLRLIVDRRRANALEVPFRRALWAMMSTSPLSAEERAETYRLFCLPSGSQT